MRFSGPGSPETLAGLLGPDCFPRVVASSSLGKQSVFLATAAAWVCLRTDPGVPLPAWGGGSAKTLSCFLSSSVPSFLFLGICHRACTLEEEDREWRKWETAPQGGNGHPAVPSPVSCQGFQRTCTCTGHDFQAAGCGT